MARRYYLTRIIGTGTEDDPYRTAIADSGLPLAYRTLVPSDPVTGAPRHRWSLTVVAGSASDHAALAALPGVDLLGDDAERDVPLPAGDRTRINRRLRTEGADEFSTPGVASSRTLIEHAGRQLEPGFAIGGLWVRDPDEG